VNDISRENKVKAVAYLSGNKEAQPEQLKKLFVKIEGFQQKGLGLEGALKQAYDSIDQINNEMRQVYGAISAVTDIIADELTKEQVEEYSKKLTELPNKE